jgi:long-chain acyl-CoA synthetase
MPRAPYARGMLIADAAIETARDVPDRVAVVRGAECVTYGELGQRIEATAGQVTRACGDARGRAVALLIEDPVELLAAFLGVVHAGGVAAPLSAEWTPDQRQRAVEACGATLVIAKPVRLGPVGDDTAVRPRVQPGAPFYVGFTSGSTGEPRGVVRSHEAWTRSFEAMSAAFGIEPGAGVLVPGSLVFSFSLIAALHALSIGGTVVLPARPGVRGLLDALAEGADAVHVLPSVLREALTLAERRGQSFEGIRRIICAGEPLGAETRALVARRCSGARLYEYYGASELGFVTLLEPEAAVERPESVGRAFPGSEVAVLDELGEAVPPGVTGLLCARTPYGGLRYAGGEDLDVALAHGESAAGWRTVGDLARMDADGYVTLVGRRDRMVVIRGENVYPEAIEAVLSTLPSVRRIAVLPEPADRPSHLVAVVEVDEGVEVAAILDAARVGLPVRQRPRRVVRLEAMPLTATGKIDLAALAALIEGQ